MRTLIQDSPVVYVVDDDESIRKSLSRLIKAAGFRVQSFASAMEFLGEPPAASDACIVLDIRMPGMTGLELAAHLEESGNALPVIFITAHDDEYLDIPETSNILACLHKPLDAEDLLGMIKKGLAKWEKPNRTTTE